LLTTKNNKEGHADLMLLELLTKKHFRFFDSATCREERGRRRWRGKWGPIPTARPRPSSRARYGTQRTCEGAPLQCRFNESCFPTRFVPLARVQLTKSAPRRQGAGFPGPSQRRSAGAREHDAAGFLRPARPRRAAGSVLSHWHTGALCLPACAEEKGHGRVRALKSTTDPWRPTLSACSGPAHSWPVVRRCRDAASRQKERRAWWACLHGVDPADVAAVRGRLH